MGVLTEFFRNSSRPTETAGAAASAPVHMHRYAGILFAGVIFACALLIYLFLQRSTATNAPLPAQSIPQAQPIADASLDTAAPLSELPTSASSKSGNTSDSHASITINGQTTTVPPNGSISKMYQTDDSSVSVQATNQQSGNTGNSSSSSSLHVDISTSNNSSDSFIENDP